MATTKVAEALTDDRSQDIALRELIPAEVTLETIGFFTPSSKQLKKKVKSFAVSYRNAEGDQETATVEIVPNVKVGLPITIDLDYYRAFQKVLYEFLQTGGDIHAPIPFSTRQLIDYAGKSYGSGERKNVRTWLERMVGTTISTRVYNHKTRSYVTLDGPPFSQVISKGDDLGNGQVAETNAVWLAPYYKKTFAAGYLRPVDLELHNSLTQRTAKHLYPILETGFHASNGNGYSKSYSDLCSELELKQRDYHSEVKRQLDPSFRELKDVDYLESWSYRKSKRKADIVITARPGKRYFSNKAEQAERKERWQAMNREQKQRNDPHVMAEQQDILKELSVLLSCSSTDFGLISLFRKYSHELIRTGISETKLAARTGQIKSTKRQYLFWVIENIQQQRQAHKASD